MAIRINSYWKDKIEKWGNRTTCRGFSPWSEKRAKELAKDKSSVKLLECVLHKPSEWSDGILEAYGSEICIFKPESQDDTRADGP